MPRTKLQSGRGPQALPKAPTGIRGLDQVTEGGLPAGRPTLITGTAGCGKTLFGIEFLVRGATEYNEPGVFVAFEETAQDLAANVASLGFDLEDLVERKRLVIDHVRVDRAEIEETGEYDLEALFVRLGYAIDTIGAKRVVLDTIEVLFSGLQNTAILRSELGRLFRWLKDRGVTAIITAERGNGPLTRHGLEEYVSDCVILLDHRVNDQITTRRLRIVKYRGSTHGTNEYPFLIDVDGISVLPITSLALGHSASTERVSTGVPRLDTMLDGGGYYRGSSILLSGTPGAGKTSLAGHFATAAAARGERCLYFAFEESPDQICRNMASIGLDMRTGVKKGLLRFVASRPSAFGLEMHLALLHRAVEEFDPQIVIVDPVTSLTSVGTRMEVTATLTRLIDYLKAKGITTLFTTLTENSHNPEQTEVEISSLIDTWLLLRNIESDGERNRGLYVLKSRGMNHSNQIHEFKLTAQGVQLVDAYIGPKGVLTGSARVAQEGRDAATLKARQHNVQRRQRELEHRRNALEAQIAQLRAAFASEEEMLLGELEQALAKATATRDAASMQRLRGSDALSTATTSSVAQRGHGNATTRRAQEARNGAKPTTRARKTRATRSGRSRSANS